MPALALFGCGLPSPQLALLPPTLPNSYYLADDTKTFEFFNPQNQNIGGAQSAGFELYYKFYDFSQNPNGLTYDVQQMSDAFASLTPPTSVPGYLTATLGFRRVVAVPSGYTPTSVTSVQDDLSAAQLTAARGAPAIPIDPAQMAFSFSVNFSFSSIVGSTSPWAYPPVVSTAFTGSVPIGRLLPDPNSSSNSIIRGFGAADLFSTDADLPSSFITPTSASPDQLQVAFVAVAYANDVLATPPLVSYSIPLSLTYVLYPIGTKAS